MKVPYPGLSTRVHEAVRGLSPGCFAMVMATGIVSIGLHLEGFEAVSVAMLVVAAIGFVVLIVLTVWRLAAYRHEMVEDFTHPARAFGFYTFVAAANVLGSRLIGAGHHLWPAVLLGISAVLWLARGYAVPWTTRLGAGEHPIVAAANGTWFMWAVAAQSIAVAAAALERVWHAPGLAMLAVVAWALGLFLYLVDGVFVAMRLLAYDFRPADLTPPYWVAMGAAAISVLAGARVVQMSPGAIHDAVQPLARGVSYLMWAVATWLLPGLFAMGWWRHVTHRVPLRYDPSLWAIVFPLGMYAVACSFLAHADAVPYLGAIGAVWIWVSFTAWALTMLGMVQHVVAHVLMPPR